MLLLKLNPIEPPWYGPVCPVVWEGRRREVSPYPDHGVELGSCTAAQARSGFGAATTQTEIQAQTLPVERFVKSRPVISTFPSSANSRRRADCRSMASG
jgi:hypothetical protein